MNSYPTQKPILYTAIVCAFNEEKTIDKVIWALLESAEVGEIIIIDDGSSDNTTTIVRYLSQNPRVKAVLLSKNHGKGYAMAEGITRASGETILFIDADLLNLSPSHISMLIDTWRKEEQDMIIGLREIKSNLVKTIDATRSLSGERVLRRKDVLPLIQEMRNSRYGVETLINLHFRSQGKRIHYLTLTGLKHPIKIEKVTWHKALSQYTEEGFHIGKVYFNFHKKYAKQRLKQLSTLV